MKGGGVGFWGFLGGLEFVGDFFGGVGILGLNILKKLEKN